VVDSRVTSGVSLGVIVAALVGVGCGRAPATSATCGSAPGTAKQGEYRRLTHEGLATFGCRFACVTEVIKATAFAVVPTGKYTMWVTGPDIVKAAQRLVATGGPKVTVQVGVTSPRFAYGTMQSITARVGKDSEAVHDPGIFAIDGGPDTLAPVPGRGCPPVEIDITSAVTSEGKAFVAEERARYGRDRVIPVATTVNIGVGK
jgi:hypothetical protein